jgi:hypothetical protein
MPSHNGTAYAAAYANASKLVKRFYASMGAYTIASVYSTKELVRVTKDIQDIE